MSDHNPLTLKLNLRERVTCGMGDVGSNLMLSIGTLCLLKFYTGELGIPIYYGEVIFLVAKFFTAFTDMLTGLLPNSRKNIGPKGKSRPFILYAVILAALIVTLQFITTTSSLPIKTTIATALLMMFGPSYSLMNCSYGVIIPAITKNLDERVQLTACRQGGATIGLLICTVVFIPLQSLFSDSTIGYTYAVLMFSIGGFIFIMLCYRGVKEYYVDTAPTRHRTSVLKSFRAVFYDPPLLALYVASLCTLAALNIKLATQVYHTQHVLNDINLLSWMGFFSMGCILIDVLLVPLTVKCFGKRQVYLAGMVLWAVGDILNYCWGSNSFTFAILSCVAFFDTAFVNNLNQALVPDTVDHGEWKIGIRAGGSVYTSYTFFHKISAALAGFLSGIMLAQVGYIPNTAQSDAALQGSRQFIFIWPCALAIIAALTMGFFYTLNEKRFTLIIEEINQRKSKEIKTEEKTASITLQVSVAAILILMGGGLPTFRRWACYEKY